LPTGRIEHVAAKSLTRPCHPAVIGVKAADNTRRMTEPLNCPQAPSPLLGLRDAVVQYRRMQPAMRNIVDAYVRLGNRKALNDLRASRERLIVGLKTLGVCYDPSKVVAQFADEIALIEAALAKLDKAA
jgi:hypothetical protein